MNGWTSDWDFPFCVVALAVPLPTKLNDLPSTLLNFVNTSPTGLPMVELLLPAYNNATGLCEELLVTISDPESPPALNELLLITT